MHQSDRDQASTTNNSQRGNRSNNHGNNNRGNRGATGREQEADAHYIKQTSSSNESFNSEEIDMYHCDMEMETEYYLD